MRRKVTKAKGVHGGSRPRRDSTKAFTSVRREIDRRVARSVASKSMGTAGTAFRTFDSWKTDGQVFSPPLPRIDTRDGREEGWPCFSGEILGKKKEEGGEKDGQGEKEREREKGGKKGRKKETKREEERSTTNRLVGIERGFCAGYAALVGMEGKRRAIRRRRRGGGV